MNPNEALGLPSGSVRAILALAIVGAFTFMALLGKVPPEQFTPVAVSVVGFYFISAANKPAAPVEPAPQPEPQEPLAGVEVAP